MIFRLAFNCESGNLDENHFFYETNSIFLLKKHSDLKFWYKYLGIVKNLFVANTEGLICRFYAFFIRNRTTALHVSFRLTRPNEKKTDLSYDSFPLLFHYCITIYIALHGYYFHHFNLFINTIFYSTPLFRYYVHIIIG